MGLFSWLRNGRGVAGLLGGAAVWMLSEGLLTLAMRANWAAAEQMQVIERMRVERMVLHLNGSAVGWSLGFIALQLISFVIYAFVLRSCYRLRTAVCYALGAGLVMAADATALFGLLVWMRVMFA